jgi:hypothetical protein
MARIATRLTTAGTIGQPEAGPAVASPVVRPAAVGRLERGQVKLIHHRQEVPDPMIGGQQGAGVNCKQGRLAFPVASDPQTTHILNYVKTSFLVESSQESGTPFHEQALDKPRPRITRHPL